MASRIAVFGAGNIGCYVGGTLALAGHDVVFVGRERLRDEIADHGLTLLDRGQTLGTLRAVRYLTDPAALSGAGLVLVTVKLGGLAAASQVLARHAAPDTLIVTLENGIGIASRLRDMLPGRRIVGGIVAFNVAPLGNGRWEKASAGPIYARRHPQLDGLGFTLVDDMRPVEWGKLLLNLTNAVNALSGLPLKATLSQQSYRRVLAASLHEALAALHVANIAPAKVGPTAPQLMARGLPLPDWLFNRLLLPRFGISDSARLSMSADYDAGRPTEIAELNGRVVELGAAHGVPTPVNERLVRLVQAGGRHWPASDLLRELRLA